MNGWAPPPLPLKSPPSIQYKISDTVSFLYLAFLYLAEAIIIMPSSRNHILDLFLIWQRQFLGMASLRNLSFLLPVLLLYQNLKYGHGSGQFVDFASYHYFFIPKFKTRRRQRPSLEFTVLLAIITNFYIPQN